MPVIKSIKQHKILLDTHVWLWLLSGNPILSTSFCQSVDRAQNYEGIIISAISVWEIGMLVARGRISLEMDCLDWVDQALANRGVKLIPLSPHIAIHSTCLPGNIHGDPADRILVATAFEEGAVLITCDQFLLEYGKDKFISVHDPR